ncbi:MAG: putative 2-dehydropantoate 2-reductase [Rubripirellula sp.]|nr:putative 2-dehydropantoate 2-reductase [Rubripirellula sp.]
MSNSETQRYALIGTGAVGGLYGGMLARSGVEVHFLLNSDYQHVSQHGLKVESPLGDFHLPRVHTHATAETMPACDVTIVGLKTTSNHLLPTLLPPTTRDGGIVLVLQNGLDIEADAASIVGTQRVLGGCCFLCSNKIGPGFIKHLDYGHIVFGEYDQLSTQISPRVQRIADEMKAAGIDAQPTADLAAARWRKLMWNIPFNGLSVVLDASTKQLIDDPDAVQIVEAMIDEVHHAATVTGVDVDPAQKARTVEVTRQMVPYDSSMRLDYLNQRPMEIEAIIGNPLKAARQCGVAMPTVAMLYQQLKFIERVSTK